MEQDGKESYSCCKHIRVFYGTNKQYYSKKWNSESRGNQFNRDDSEKRQNVEDNQIHPFVEHKFTVESPIQQPHKYNCTMSNSQATKRRTTANNEDDRDTKRTKLFEDYVCPINLTLIVEPVVAEDGHLYDLSAITKHIRTKNAAKQKMTSPMTNETMGTNLIPVCAVKNAITKLVENGDVDDEIAEEWKADDYTRQLDGGRYNLDEIREYAIQGNEEAMGMMAKAYYFGVSPDNEKAKEWTQKAANAGNIACMASWAHLFEENEASIVSFISLAAQSGSDLACLKLGLAHAKGMYGLPVDKNKAIRWITTGLEECEFKNATQEYKEGARAVLLELKAGTH